MKKQINLTIKAHLIRSAFYVVLLLAVCAIPFALAQSRSRGTTKRSAAASVSQITASQLPRLTCLVVNGDFETGELLPWTNTGDTSATGVDSNNPKVRNISASDLQDIEAIFYEAKSTAIQTRESGGQFEYKPEPGELGIEGEVEAQFFDGWSCCSCTPCCCCAAAVVDPLDDNEVYA